MRKKLAFYSIWQIGVAAAAAWSGMGHCANRHELTYNGRMERQLIFSVSPQSHLSYFYDYCTSLVRCEGDCGSDTCHMQRVRWVTMLIICTTRNTFMVLIRSTMRLMKPSEWLNELGKDEVFFVVAVKLWWNWSPGVGQTGTLFEWLSLCLMEVCGSRRCSIVMPCDDQHDIRTSKVISTLLYVQIAFVSGPIKTTIAN